MLTGEFNLERVYREHGHVVLRRARRILGNNEDAAREALQEIFLSLTEHPQQFAGNSSIITFLYRMTTNLCLNKLRNQRRRTDLEAHSIAATSDSKSPTTEAAAMAQSLLLKLSPKLAQVAVHYYIDEMTHEEIATMLGCSRRMVGKLVARLQKEAAI